MTSTGLSSRSCSAPMLILAAFITSAPGCKDDSGPQNTDGARDSQDGVGATGGTGGQGAMSGSGGASSGTGGAAGVTGGTGGAVGATGGTGGAVGATGGTGGAAGATGGTGGAAGATGGTGATAGTGTGGTGGPVVDAPTSPGRDGAVGPEMTPPPPLTPTEVCAQWQEICGRISICGVMFGHHGSRECLMVEAGKCVNQTIGTGVTLTQMSECLQKLKAVSCNDAFYNDDPYSLCTGNRAEGASCSTGQQCQSGYCSMVATVTPLCPSSRVCVAQTMPSCGTCTARSGEGAQCDRQAACSNPFVCRGGDGPSRCVRLGGAGESCQDFEDCARGFGCVNRSCVALGLRGAPCADDRSCEQSRLLVCDPTSKTCQPAGVALVGAPCGFDVNRLQCGDAATCVPTARNGVCRPISQLLTNPILRGRCGPEAPGMAVCAAGTVCDSKGTCQSPRMPECPESTAANLAFERGSRARWRVCAASTRARTLALDSPGSREARSP